MSLHPHAVDPIPEQTARIARAAFRRGNSFMRMRDEIGTLFTDEAFAPLFPARGRPVVSPWCLALVCVMQYVEGLSARQAAEAVRTASPTLPLMTASLILGLMVISGTDRILLRSTL